MRFWQRVFQRLFAALYRKRVSLLLFLVLGVGIGEYTVWQRSQVAEASAAGVYPVEVSIQPIQMRDEGQNVIFILTLKETTGNRRISMTVNNTEALAIARERGVTRGNSQAIKPTEGPEAYKLMSEAISQVGGRIDRIVVNDADQRGYYAQVIISANGETRTISARPGDAAALALKSGARLYVEDKVLEDFGTKGGGTNPSR